jgi:hypothetical protein
MTAKDVIACLKVYFATPAYCLLEQVADGTGARQHRWADAVAMSVWPSRGYDIHGIEVKVSKSDWKSELKQVEKSTAVQQYMNRWWICTPDETIIAPGELPPTWGWMVCTAKGTMKVIVPAPVLTPKPISVEFMASILRNVQKADETMIERACQKEYSRGYENGGTHYRDSYARIKKTVEEFEAASGLRLNEYADGKELGDAVNTLHNLKYRVQHIGSAIKACQDIALMLEQVELLASLHTSKENIGNSSPAASQCPLPASK